MTLTYNDIQSDVLAAMKPPGKLYYLTLALLAGGIALALSAWVWQVRVGMGLAGINIPVAWAVYITNFVFWVGIAHSGTLISAILHLVRARWRNSISRAAEAMTVFAIMTAGLFPLIHLGRLWVFYYIIPYPSQRGLWPNFTSPLVWDVVAITTYLTVSVIFFYVGTIPDLAAARDHYDRQLGPASRRARIYGKLALGWIGSGTQWAHYGRGYLFFAALATPLVVSVHSVVSWDFAMSLLPGWHNTIFAPYFVAGAIHSGLAMVLFLLIPLRRLLKLQRLITIDHFESVAKTMLVTTMIIGYAYILEPFIAWYSGDVHEWQFAKWRATGWLAAGYWAMSVLNVLVPLTLLVQAVRRNIKALLTVGILVNIGMWMERFVIIVGSTSHDFMPHNWATYAPRPVEYVITFGSFTFFLFWFLLFSKLLPTVPANDIKSERAQDELGQAELSPIRTKPASLEAGGKTRHKGVLAVFADAGALVAAVQRVIGSGIPFQTYSPAHLPALQEAHSRSPVRYWAFFGALAGLAGGFALAIGSAEVNKLIVGGKPPVAIIPFCITGFEGMVLLGSLANLAGLLVHCRLGRRAVPEHYDRRFSLDRFGLLVECDSAQVEQAKELLATARPEEVHVL